MIVERFVSTFDIKGATLQQMDERDAKYGNKCPKCGEPGKTEVHGLHEFWYCENPDCSVNRHFSSGYYEAIESDKKPVRILQSPDDVQELKPFMRFKRIGM